MELGQSSSMYLNWSWVLWSLSHLGLGILLFKILAPSFYNVRTALMRRWSSWKGECQHTPVFRRTELLRSKSNRHSEAQPQANSTPRSATPSSSENSTKSFAGYVH